MKFTEFVIFWNSIALLDILRGCRTCVFCLRLILTYILINSSSAEPFYAFALTVISEIRKIKLN